MNIPTPLGYCDWPLLVDQIGFLEEIYPTLLNPDSFASRIVSSTLTADIDTIQLALDRIVYSCLALRQTMKLNSSGWSQGADHRQQEVLVVDLSQYNAVDQETLINRVLVEISVSMAGPIYKFVIVKLARKTYRVLSVVHHLACDYYSLTRLNQDISRLTMSRSVEISRSTIDDYVGAVQGMAALAYSPLVREEYFERWSTMSWDACVGLPARASILPGTVRAPADIWAADLAIPHSVAIVLARSHLSRVKEIILNVARMVFCRHFGGSLTAAIVHNGRDLALALRRRPEAAVPAYSSQPITAIGWFTITGLVVLSPNSAHSVHWDSDMELMSTSWGLLQRISRRSEIADIVREHGRPGLWINIIRDRRMGGEFSGNSAKIADPRSAIRRKLTEDGVPLGAANDILFEGIPLALNVCIDSGGVGATLTWDATLMSREGVYELRNKWQEAWHDYGD